MKRGQAEIIGLVVVVLLLVFALIFFVKTKSVDEDTETKLIRTTIRANSALNAIMKVHIQNKQMKDLISDCYEQSINVCENIRDYLNVNLDKIFDSGYYFALQDFGGNVHVDNSDSINLVSMEFGNGKNCRQGIEASPFIVKGRGKIVLKVCT